MFILNRHISDTETTLNKKKDLNGIQFYLLYTILFCVASLIIYGVFLYNGKSFVFCDKNKGGDGLVQAYNGFVYFGKYLREIARTFINEHKLSVPMWDLNIGYGQDIFTTLNFYVIGEPINLLSAIVPVKYSEIAYTSLIILRIYLAGIAFSIYCRYRGNKSLFVLTGALIYIGSQYAMTIGTLHPHFLMPMVMFPLVCLGIEKILNERKHFLFILSVFIFVISSFYMFYMMVIICVIYTALRYIELHMNEGIRIVPLLKSIGEFAVDGLLAVGMGAFLFLPSAMAILVTPRVNVTNGVPLLYDVQYYLSLFSWFMSGGARYYAFMGFTAMGLISVLVIAITAKNNRCHRFMLALFGIFSIILCVPYLGHLMNGGGYVVNRWIWAFTFWIAYIVANALPELERFTYAQWKILTVLSIVWIIPIVILHTNRTERYMAAIALLFGAILILYLTSQKKAHRISSTAIILTLLMLAHNSFYEFFPAENDRLLNYANQGEAYNMLVDQAPASILRGVNTESIYRYDTAAISMGDAKRNVSMQIKIPGVPFYYSTISGSVSEFNHGMKLNYNAESTYENLDRRAMLESILGVKVIVIPRGKEIYLPYEYKNEIASNDKYVAYSTDLAFPLAFVTDKTYSLGAFSSLDVIKKQETMMQAVVIENSNNNGGIEFLDEAFSPEIEASEGIEIQDNKIIVKNKNSKLILKTGKVSGSELYVRMTGIGYSGIHPKELVSIENMSKLDRNNFIRNNRYWTEPTSVAISMNCGGEGTSFIYRTEQNPYYSGFHECLLNLGYSEEEREDIQVSFNAEGIYTFDTLQVVIQPMQQMAHWRNGTCKEEIKNLQIEANRIKGEYSSEVDGIAFFSIPYSEGWKAYIDGEETKVLKANIAFMGVAAPSGSHEIELKYRTPYMRVGIICSLVCVFFTAIWLLLNSKKRNKTAEVV